MPGWGAEAGRKGELAGKQGQVPHAATEREIRLPERRCSSLLAYF